MKKYEFTRDLVCAGVKRTAGEIVPENEIPDGSLGSLLRTGMAREYVEPPPVAPEPAAKPASEKKSKADKE